MSDTAEELIALAERLEDQWPMICRELDMSRVVRRYAALRHAQEQAPDDAEECAIGRDAAELLRKGGTLADEHVRWTEGDDGKMAPANGASDAMVTLHVACEMYQGLYLLAIGRENEAMSTAMDDEAVAADLSRLEILTASDSHVMAVGQRILEAYRATRAKLSAVVAEVERLRRERDGWIAVMDKTSPELREPNKPTCASRANWPNLVRQLRARVAELEARQA